MIRNDNPLNSCVTVNRFWQQIFGSGIVKTSEDFGLQSELPSHPNLLDYLAVGFQGTGFDVKALVKQIVMSANYAENLVQRKDLKENDRKNRLLA